MLLRHDRCACLHYQVDAILRDMVAITLRTDISRNQRTNLETCVAHCMWVVLHVHPAVMRCCFGAQVHHGAHAPKGVN
jgi:hypothetical protein